MAGDAPPALARLADALHPGDTVSAADLEATERGSLAVVHVRDAAGAYAQRLARLPEGFPEAELDAATWRASALASVRHGLAGPG